MLSESQGTRVRVRQDMVGHGAEVRQCAQLDLEEAAVRDRLGSTHAAQDSVH